MPDLVVVVLGVVLILAGLLVRALKYAPVCTCGEPDCGGGCCMPSRRNRP